MQGFIMLMIVLSLLAGCKTTTYNDKFGPRETELGETVDAPFQGMIEGARQNDPLLGQIYFAASGDDLSSESREELDRVAGEIANREGPVIIEGHADLRDEGRDRKTLGYQRALAVAEYLKTAGVWEERMVLHSFSDTRPAAHRGENPDNNQRVEIKMFRQGEGLSGKEAQRIYKKMINPPEEKPAQPLGALLFGAPAEATEKP